MGKRVEESADRRPARQDPELLRRLLRAGGVELTQEPVERYGTVDAGFRDPSGNGWKMIETRRAK